MKFQNLTGSSNPLDIQAAYQEWAAANGGDTESNRGQAQGYLSNLGLGQGTINDAYTMYKSQLPGAAQPAAQATAPTGQAYTRLNNNSSAADIAGAYKDWSGGRGGDTQANRTEAQNYLSGIGIGSGAANDAYSAYKGPQQQQQPPQQQQNLGMGGGGYNPGQNPYLRQMGVDVGNQMFDQWSRNTLPSIRSGAMAAGGFGGSRQGVVEANGINDKQRNYGQALTSMYGNDWSQQQGRNLQQQGLNNSYDLGLKSNDLQNRSVNNSYDLGLKSNDLQNRSVNNSYDLGLRSNDLGFSNLDANINQNNFGNQMQAANFGMGVYNTLNGQTQAGIQAGTNIQNTPLDYQKYFTNSANGVGSGYGTSSTSQTNQGNPWLGALGGAQIGNQIQKNWG